MSGMNVNAGVNLNEMFKNGMESVGKDGQAIQTKLQNALNKDAVDPTEMMQIQFEMGQYNAKLEALSSITKSMQDMLKSLAQRTG